MQITGNTILITGGGTGIGRGLAEAFHAKGNRVVIAGRRQDLLNQVTAANPGMKSAVLDIASADSISGFSQQIGADFPSLNVVIHNAGIMKPEKIETGELSASEETIAINLLGPIRLNGALLPLLRQQPQATIMTVSSGLAFLPMAGFPTYCATKAAIHSWTQSLRYQLRDSSIQVIELIPPYVQTELTGQHQASDPNAMPLKDFVSEVMDILTASPEAGEILVGRVKPLRFAEVNGGYDEFFRKINDAASAAR